ncbi:hypothetical protein NITHO_2640006 [Nitrolancea hollandica Lb]|uniref:Uncharacterized protein n=1 Tax=Nitrolancea hollandica Lb TaxID=1129897 RepID=I4EGA4_9BACT|nr:hypothetical protein NITHO_2640006 [Nitrolancea hollandica Lb]
MLAGYPILSAFHDFKNSTSLAALEEFRGQNGPGELACAEPICRIDGALPHARSWICPSGGCGHGTAG